ncbi:hypothetical protein FRB99_005408 [Tulasnella sp. 403]|nr:hypothetical protein FRB99_005408 [Tulasnella sp. 403]
MLQVSSSKRLVQVVVSVFFNLTCAGVIFGFAALKTVLVKEGVYSELCEGDDHPEIGRPCDDQDLRLNYMFTLSTVITNVAALPVGAILDRVGPKYTSLLGAIIFAIGNLVFPVDYRKGVIDTYFVGYICLAIGGPLIFLPSFHLSNTFPAQAGLILSCVTGAFDASSVPYLLYDVVYDRLVVFQMTIAPSASYLREDFEERAEGALPGSESEGEAPIPGSSPVEDSMVRGLEANLSGKNESRDRVIGVMFDRSASEQIGSTWFV